MTAPSSPSNYSPKQSVESISRVYNSRPNAFYVEQSSADICQVLSPASLNHFGESVPPLVGLDFKTSAYHCARENSHPVDETLPSPQESHEPNIVRTAPLPSTNTLDHINSTTNYRSTSLLHLPNFPTKPTPAPPSSEPRISPNRTSSGGPPPAIPIPFKSNRYHVVNDENLPHFEEPEVISQFQRQPPLDAPRPYHTQHHLHQQQQQQQQQQQLHHLSNQRCSHSPYQRPFQEKENSRADLLLPEEKDYICLEENSRLYQANLEVYIGLLGIQAVFIYANFVFSNIAGGLLSLFSFIAACYSHLDRRTSSYLLTSVVTAIQLTVTCIAVSAGIRGFAPYKDDPILRAISIGSIPLGFVFFLDNLYLAYRHSREVNKRY